MDGDRLTPEEDATLRRLHALEELGIELSPTQRALKDALRARDRRDEIRVPKEDDLVVPLPAHAPEAVAVDFVEW